MTHVFISYVRENSNTVEWMASVMKKFGIEVWLDKEEIRPGLRWEDEIMGAIQNGAYFLACFSQEYNERTSTYMNEELTLAVEELRKRHWNTGWFIPVLLNECEVPRMSIGAGRTMHSIQWVRLYEDYEQGIRKIVGAIKNEKYSHEEFSEILGNKKQSEMEFIVGEFSPFLMKRCQYLIEHTGLEVCLVIDSSSLLLSLFRRIGEIIVNSYEDGGSWVNRLRIITNDLIGAKALVETQWPTVLRSSRERYSGLIINCEILPGMPVRSFAAVLGPETNEAMMKMLSTKGEDRLFLTVACFDWIRFTRTEPICPVPIVRSQGHLSFQQLLIDGSDEVFVVSPLGKVLVNAGPEVISELARYSDPGGLDRVAYCEAMVDTDAAKKLKVITTARKENNLLYHHSRYVNALIDSRNEFGQDDYKMSFMSIPHMTFVYDDLPESKRLELEQEFPHVATRGAAFLREYFHVARE